jgi:GNAT superfamily N-acetyltransferase
VTRIGDEIRLLEGLAAEAWRGLVEQDLDGWRLRAAAGVTHRANSVLTLEHRGDRSVSEKVAAVEAFALEHGIPPAFLMTDVAEPSGLDRTLADAGYRLELPVDVLVAELDDLRGPHPEIEHQLVPDDEWAEVWWPELGGERSTAMEILRRPLPAVTHVAVREDGRIVAVGRGVAQEGWLGVYGMATTPSHQGQGLGRGVLAALAEWGGDHGADSAHLQVTADNAPAQRLYAAAGFRPHHRYWYRVKGHGPPFT